MSEPDKYDHRTIEKKWQADWEKTSRYHANKPTADKVYVLDMFPYPSGDGLHVGHPLGYIGSDILARYFRAKGKTVLHPMGWDAFGLPAENYAIKTGVHPAKTTKKAITRYREQLQMIGLSYDWDREISTADPNYYRWTQWLFLKLYERGLAYRAEAPVNWCPMCQTVLANEQVKDAKCERCDTPVIQKELAQWFFKIIDYADELLKDVDKLDWPEPIKLMQKNWIGKSEGAEISFTVPYFPKILIATNNQSKVKRIRRLGANLGIEFVTPKDEGLVTIEIDEGSDLIDNARRKAQAYRKLTTLPILGLDSGLYLDGQILDPAKVKRNAFDGQDEKILDQAQITRALLTYYQNLAKQHGGQLNGYWRDVLVLVTPSGDEQTNESQRPIVLTDEIHGPVDSHFPIRSLYMNQVTNKYSSEQTEIEEQLELKPYRNAICSLLGTSIPVFTTRPDTLFGATYLVLAPEHPFVARQLETRNSKLANIEEIEKYIKQTKGKKELERKTESSREKTGVKLEGIVAINPATREEIPIYIADYVLMGYGTGAIMAVPAHDERDYAFAQKYHLPIRQVIAPHVIDTTNPPMEGKHRAPRRSVMGVVRHWHDNTVLQIVWKEFPWKTFVIGGAEGDEDPEVAIRREVHEETGYKNFQSVRQLTWELRSEWYAAHKDVNRYAKMHIFELVLANGERDELSLDEQAKHTLAWIPFNDIPTAYGPVGELDFIWQALKNDQTAYTASGVVIHSGDFSEMSSVEAQRTITQSVGGTWTSNFRLRDWLVSRQRYWGAPIPIIYCDKCLENSKLETRNSKLTTTTIDGKIYAMWPVPTEQLPVLLPNDVDFKPTGQSPLIDSQTFNRDVICPNCGAPARREADTMDTFVDSSWYFLRYPDTTNNSQPFDPSVVNSWLPVDWYVGGAEHAVLHLLYARFITKALADFGYLNFREPFTHLRNQGLIMGEDNRKMSKRWGNVINPDDVVRIYGADALRCFEMFMGPFEDAKPWSTSGLIGMRRWLERIFRLSAKARKEPSEKSNQDLERLLHQTIQKVTGDIEGFQFNTAISQLMILTNQLEKTDQIDRKTWQTFLQLLCPFAPHLSHELWEKAGYSDMPDDTVWPMIDPTKLVAKDMTLAVQVNGKIRGQLIIQQSTDETTVIQSATKLASVIPYLKDRVIRRTVFIPGRIINFVVDFE